MFVGDTGDGFGGSAEVWTSPCRHTPSRSLSPVFCPEVLALPGRLPLHPPLRGSLPTGWCQAAASGPEPTDTRCSGAVNGAALKLRFSALSVPPPTEEFALTLQRQLAVRKIRLRSQQNEERSLHSRGSIGARPPPRSAGCLGFCCCTQRGGSASSSQCRYRPKVENTSICFGG